MGDDFFSTVDAGVESASMSEEELVKALSAGYGTDAAQFMGGRALEVQDIEATMINAMREQREDCKLMNLVKKRPVHSTVHEYNRRLDVGEYENLTADEGGGSEDNDQTIKRVTRNIKYLQDRRAVTDQMEIVDGYENAVESEKIGGTLNVLKGAEFLNFHGDSKVVPTQYDGLVAQILADSNPYPNVKDLRGKSLTAYGEKALNEMTRIINGRGGDASLIFFPPVIAEQIQDLVRDRLRFGTEDRKAALVVDTYPTPFGSTLHFGEEAGSDKLFKVKGPVFPNGKVDKRPNPPASVAAAAAVNSNSQFFAADAGDYNYAVHSISKYGISDGKLITAVVAVAAGKAVNLTITPDSSKPGTGFVITRSEKDGTALMEVCRIANSGSATTTFVDLNADLPGTASMIFLTEKKLQTTMEFYQLCPLRLRPLFESNKAEKPFFIQLFGALDLKVPEWCGIVKNIAYDGGFDY
jgi:hypothetical protein